MKDRSLVSKVLTGILAVSVITACHFGCNQPDGQQKDAAPRTTTHRAPRDGQQKDAAPRTTTHRAPRVIDHFAQGNRYFSKQQYREAIAAYDKAIQVNPSSRAYYNRGFAKMESGQELAAISDYTKAIERNPSYAKAYYHRGIAYGLLNNGGEAYLDFKAAEIFAEKIGDDDTYRLAKKATEALEKLLE